MSRHFRIHPAIGVARVGDSDEFFIGPEQPGVPANWSHSKNAFEPFRDTTSKIRRQGARFRVFELVANDDGTVSTHEVRPQSEGVARITWSVHIANRKASFFTFNGISGEADFFVARDSQAATKIEKSATADDPERANRRNAQVPLADREAALDIDPGEITIEGKLQGPVELKNSKSSIPIPHLGHVRTDPDGNLIVLGGNGVSASVTKPPTLDEYANNDGWFDDVGDGPVRARIALDDGTIVDADAAWIVVGPPDFAPAVGNVVSLYDTLWDLAVRSPGIVVRPGFTQREPFRRLATQKACWTTSNALDGYKPSFTEEIFPILQRALAARRLHIPMSNPDYHRTFDDDDLGTLASLPGVKSDREGIMKKIRDPDGASVDYNAMPRGLGDDYASLDAAERNGEAPSPRSFVSLTRVQYALLKQWEEGEFVSDWPGSAPEIPPEAPTSPEGLDQAALENCVGAPFYPGIEVSWLVRAVELYGEPFRLKVAARSDREAQQPKIGSLQLRPGFFSQQMAQPWQADFYDCHKEEHEDDEGHPWFYMWWTAQRPDDVFPKGETQQVRWVRAFAPDPEDDEDPGRFAKMVENWQRLGFVIRIGNDLVEDERG